MPPGSGSIVAIAMDPNPTSTKELEPSTLSVRLAQALRRYLVAGLAALFPVWVTLFLVWKIFEFVDGFLGKGIAKLLGFQIPGLGLVATILVILLVGVFSIHFFGRVVFRTIEGGLVRLPFVKKIYPPVKQLAQFLFSEEKRPTGFRRVVLAQWPRMGSYSIAFVTNESRTTVTGKPTVLLTLLIPTPPSPLTGPIIFLPEEDVIPLTLSIEDAFKLMMSGGVVAPPLQAAQRTS